MRISSTGTEVDPSPEAAAERRASTYLPIGPVAIFLQLTLGLFVLASVASVFTAIPYRAHLLDISLGSPVPDRVVALAEDRYDIAFWMVTASYTATAIVFLTWFWRAYSNLTYLGRARRRRPGWAVGGWFIPVAGLVIPYGIAAEIWTQSKPDPVSIQPHRDPNMEPVISWWALFLIVSLVNVVQALMLDEDPSIADLAGYVGVDIVGSVVGVAAAIAAIRFVRLATARQLDLLALRRASMS